MGAAGGCEMRKKSLFVCPSDLGQLDVGDVSLICQQCRTLYPVVRGVPVLINDDNSVFQRSDFLTEDAYQGASGYGGHVDKTAGLRLAYRRFTRQLSEANVPGSDAIERLKSQITADPTQRILAVGSGDRASSSQTIRTDVAFAEGVDCICDAHDLPFPDGSFDVVLIESVLEHVCDPQRCVTEIVRVLAPGGKVMALTPFLQPVHMGAYDFTRFTFLGHRRLFRMFDELESGMCGGPGYSAIHILRNSIICITDNRRARSILKLAMLLVTYPLRYVDLLLTRTQSSYNAGCAFYFCGVKRETPISDREIIRMFRGA